MARPRTPTNVLDLRGSFKRHPERKRTGEPKPAGKIGAAPAGLDAQQKKCWREIVKDCPPNVLTNADRWAVEICAVLMARFRVGEATGAEVGHLRALLGQLGMTPSERAKLSIEPPKPKDDWEDF